MKPTILVSLLLLSTSVAAAGDESAAVREARAQAAQVITLARLLPSVCSGIIVDDEAVAALMDHAQLTSDDLSNPSVFGPEDDATARTLAQAVDEDRGEVCDKLIPYLGERGAKLLRRKPGPSD